eukprot:4802771-Alexandrium_andersonii.AAC.1
MPSAGPETKGPATRAGALTRLCCEALGAALWLHEHGCGHGGALLGSLRARSWARAPTDRRCERCARVGGAGAICHQA